MKKIFLIVVCWLALGACSKNASPGTTTNSTTAIASLVDTFTLIDNGITYMDSENVNFEPLQLTIQKSATGSEFILMAASKPSFPVRMQMHVPGPVNSIGVYRMNSLAGNIIFSDSFGGGSGYTTDSAVINITTAAINTVKGSYQIWLNNAINTKSVSGIIRCYSASIE